MSDPKRYDSPGWERRITLKGGTVMPLIGLGTQYGFADDGHSRGSLEKGSEYVALALQTGFRLVDTARVYNTEENVMCGIESSGVDRKEVFVISKAWSGSDHAPGRETSRSAIAESAARLGGYVDLYLVHQPMAGWEDLWRALEDAKDDGLVKAIGVSNFLPEHLEELHRFARYPVEANQILLHPFVFPAQAETVRYCEQHGIAIVAYPRSPWKLNEGSVVDAIAHECGRARAQVMLRWGIDHNFAVIPLSTNERHLQENFAVREFHLSLEQRQAMDQNSNPRAPRYYVDELNGDIVAGWAFAPGGLTRIRVLVDGTQVGEALKGRPRPDVQQAFPQHPEALESGFVFMFPDGSFKNRTCEVVLVLEGADGTQIKTETTTVPNPLTASLSGDFPLPRAPFPSEVLRLLREVQGDRFPSEEDWVDEQIQSAVDELVLLVQRGSRRSEGLFRYLRYLSAVESHSKFVERFFPKVNSIVSYDAKDLISVASTPHEMLCIANHLYVLQSRGLSGRLLEFGCFKGFSTSCLSFACHLLGIGFDVFDSFQGLPPSESDWYAEGDYTGTLEEVKHNVREFGSIDNVRFHKGYFSDTLPQASVDPICIWMDVDLESSSEDVMTILPTLPRESCVFSHESEAKDFADGKLIAQRDPNSPLPPITETLAKRGGPVRGRHLLGNTCALWEQGVAVPVLPYEQLARLLDATR